MRPKPIFSFTGKYAFLSNIYPVAIVYEGETYSNVDLAFKAAKSKHKKEWTQIQERVMEELVRQKFTNYTHLKLSLIATGSKDLFAGHVGDRYWGVEHDFHWWHGENKLGELLMKIREEFKKETDPNLLELSEQDGTWSHYKIDIPLPEGMWDDLMTCAAAVKYAYYNGPADLIPAAYVVTADRVQIWLHDIREEKERKNSQ